MPDYQLAQVNVSRLAAPIDSPKMRDFLAFLAHVYTLADTTPGFVWRYQAPSGDPAGLFVFDDAAIIGNLSVWNSIESLQKFVYQGGHAYVMRKRSKWTEELLEANMALWWIPAGHIPTWAEAQDRLNTLRQHGESVEAFTFRTPFPPPNA